MKPATLAVTQIAVAATLSVVVTPLTGHISLALPWQVWAAVAWTAAMGTVYGFGVQASAQRFTTASHAAVILCLEGVFAAAFGVLFGLDSITWRLIGGAGLILTGILIVELVPGRGPPRSMFDPPYGIKFNSNFQWSTTSRDAKDGKADHITREPEQVKAFRDPWRDGIHSYLTYLRIG